MDTVVSPANYDGATADLPVSKHQKLRTFARENDALLVYCLICISALFVPSAPALGVFAAVGGSIALVFPRRRTTLALLFGLVVSCVHFYHHEATRIPFRCFDTPLKASGEIVSFPQSRVGVGESHYLSFYLNIRESIPRECGSGMKVRAYANYEGGPPAFKIGDSISGQFRLRPIGSLWNRGDLPSNVHALANKTSALASATEVKSIEPGSSYVSALRYRLSGSISYYVKHAEAERLLQALLLGRQEVLHPEDWLFLREFGIVHVLVVSGVHVSLVVLWMQYLLRFPRRLLLLRHDSGLDWLHLTAISLVASGYVLLTGASLPAQRALLMMSTTYFMRILFWRVSSLSSVVAAAAVLITINPWSALTPGFWLSILLTGIIILETADAPSQRILGWSRLTCVLTVASSLLTVFFFNQFSTATLISNLLIVPIFTVVVLPVGLVALAITELNVEVGGWLLTGIAVLVNELLSLMVATNTISGLGRLQSVYFHSGIIFILAVAALAGTLPKKLSTSIILLLPLSISGSHHLTNAAEMVVSDVGQGTMVLFSSGDYHLLYDTGGVSGSGISIAEREVIPWLKSRGISEIDLLVVSHGDLDHSGGLSAIREHFDIKDHWGFDGAPCEMGRKLPLSMAFSVAVMGGTGQGLANTNADSCVVLIEYHGQRILLAGDIPTSTELDLIASGSLPAKIDVLVAAHHGSATSSSQSFIDKLNPAHTVFTTKRANRFNHPHDSVLRRFLTKGTRLWDTARDGAVTFKLMRPMGLSASGMRRADSPYWAQF